jgi:hypothetical protein
MANTMKKYKNILLLIILTICVVGCLNAQDTIYSKDGSITPGKVQEINNLEVRYQKASNPNGPIYIANKNDISFIKFQNGTKEFFASTNNYTDTAANNGPYINNNNSTTVINNGGYNQGYGNQGYGYGQPFVFWNWFSYRRPYRHNLWWSGNYNRNYNYGSRGGYNRGYGRGYGGGHHYGHH